MYIFCLVVLCLTFIDYKAKRNSCKVGINYEFMWVLAESRRSFQRMLRNFQRFSAKVENSNLTENVSIPLQTWHKIHKHQYKLGQLTILASANHLNTKTMKTKINQIKLKALYFYIIDNLLKHQRFTEVLFYNFTSNSPMPDSGCNHYQVRNIPTVLIYINNNLTDNLVRK